MPRIGSEIDNHLDYMERALDGRDFFMGSEISAADFQLSFVAEIANAQGMTATRPNLKGFVERIQARDGYKRALEKGGPYRFRVNEGREVLTAVLTLRRGLRDQVPEQVI